MNVTKTKRTYGDPSDLTAGASYLKIPVATLAGVTPGTFPGTVTLLIGNTGANPANIYLTVVNKDVLGVAGVPIPAGQSLLLPDLDPATILVYKSAAGTTLTVQAAKSNG